MNWTWFVAVAVAIGMVGIVLATSHATRLAYHLGPWVNPGNKLPGDTKWPRAIIAADLYLLLPAPRGFGGRGTHAVVLTFDDVIRVYAAGVVDDYAIGQESFLGQVKGTRDQGAALSSIGYVTVRES